MTSAGSGSSGERGWPGLELGIFIALFSAYGIYYLSNTDLAGFPDRAIGGAIVQGVDPSLRPKFYLAMVFFPVAIVLGTHYLARWLRRRRPSWRIGVRARVENGLVNTLCAIGCVTLVAAVAANHLEPSLPLILCLSGVLLVGSLAVARRLGGGRRASRVLRNATLWDTMTPMLFLPWAAVFAAGVILKVDQPSSWRFYTLSGLPVVAYVISYLALASRQRSETLTRHRLRRAFAAGAAPLLLFPCLCPVANEIQYTLSRHREVSPRQVAMIFLAGLGLISVTTFVLALRGILRFRPSRLAGRFCFPVLVATLALLSVHRHQLAPFRKHLLHTGELVTSVDQLHRFGRLPFIDVWPAHGLSDYLGILYTQINGFRPFEIAAWDGLLFVLISAATYAVLAAISTPFFSLAVSVLLPISALFPPPTHSYFFADLPLLAIPLLLCWVMRKPTVQRHAWLGIAAFLSFFWTPASGVASILATCTLLVVSVWTAADRRRPIFGFLVFGAAGFGLFCAYLLVLAARHRPLFDTLRFILSYIQADALIGGRPALFKDFGPMVLFQYILLPAVGVGYLVVLARSAFERRPLEAAQVLLGSLTLTSLVLFSRTLTRHGLIEAFQPFFFPFLAAAVLFWVRPVCARPAQALFCAVFALYLVAFPSDSATAGGLKPFAFHAWTKGEPRYLEQQRRGRRRGSEPSDHLQLKALFDAEMRPRDTFIELLNAPLLYTYFGREVPDYFFFATMFYSTDSAERIYLKRLVSFSQGDRVPFALLSSKSARDGIPDLLRSYRLAEHLYRNYVALDSVDGLEVWISRERWDQVRSRQAPLKLPFLEVASFRQVSLEGARRDGDALWIKASGNEPHIDHFLGIAKPPCCRLACHHGLRFRYLTSVDGNVQIYFRFSGRDYNKADSGLVAVQATAGGEWREAVVAVPLQLECTVLEDIRLDPPQGAEMTMKNFELIYGERGRGKPQAFDAAMLPFVWGNFDPKAAVRTTKILQQIQLPESARHDFKTVRLPIDPNLDKTSGNYLHLCISITRPPGGNPPVDPEHEPVKKTGKWEAAGTVQLQYGRNLQASFQFDLVSPREQRPGVTPPQVEEYTRGCKNYLIRLSSQSAWMTQPVDELALTSTVPIRLGSASLRKGD